LGVPTGTPLHAAAGGRVILVQSEAESGGYGSFTCVEHTVQVVTCYAHQSRVLVHQGEVVARGQVIGLSGCTGRCFGPHLHFEVRVNGRVICPARYLAVSTSSMCWSGSA
jgi:murein DD-endopeptidase MepM/ murein hydrolase activator NlpD